MRSMRITEQLAGIFEMGDNLAGRDGEDTLTTDYFFLALLRNPEGQKIIEKCHLQHCRGHSMQYFRCDISLTLKL